MTEKKKIRFGGLLLIYITVVLTLVIAALGFLWYGLTCYEASRIEGAKDTYMTEVLPVELQYAMDTYSFERKTEYQTKKELSGILAEKLGSDNWTYRKDAAKSTDDCLVFTLYRDGDVLGEVIAHPVEASSKSLGFGGWEVVAATFDLEQFGDSITITAPYGCEVYVNGHLISEDYVTETVGLYPQLMEYEALITQPNQLLVYHLAPIFEEVAVEFSDGYSAMKDESTGIVYALPICDNAMAEEMMDYCKGFVQAYVEYTANKNALWAVQQYIVPDCALYNEMTELSRGMQWGHGVNAHIASLDIKNFRYYGNVITCEASYFMNRSDGDRSENMEILLVETILGWRVVHVKVT